MRALPPRRGQSVLVPAFHCPTIIEAIRHAGYRPLFYRVTRDLSLDAEDVRHKISRDVAAIVVVHYCGFPADTAPLLELRQQHGCLVIEDWAHSFLNAQDGSITGETGDAAVFSFYKLVPTGVGGGLRINNPAALQYQPASGRLESRRLIVLAKRLLEELIQNSGPVSLRTIFQFLESLRVDLKKKRSASQDSAISTVRWDPYWFDLKLASTRMPRLSQLLLRSSDFSSLIAIRRRNYGLLTEHLREHPSMRAVFPHLPDKVCPLAYPVICDDRSRYDWRLRAAGVPVFTFGEILHPLLGDSDRRTVEDAVYLSRNLLLIAIHQNLPSEVVVGAARTINDLLQQAA
jgi:dTDP-4-amino-4,6-dideoxygalactose transaminase